MKQLVVLVLLVLLGCGSTRAFVYFPDRSGRPCPDGVADVLFRAADGTLLHGWLLRSNGATRAILSCHGNAGNVAMREGELRALERTARAHVLLFDYRGYGLSEGEPEETGLCEDAQAALLALERETGVAPGRTVVLGHSLGGAVAIDLAWRKPAIGGLVTLSTFTSIDDLVRHLTLPGLGALVPESWDSLAKVPGIAKPKLFIHGTADGLIPIEEARLLHESAAEPKKLLLVPGADHNGILFAPGVLEAIGAFVDAVAPERTAD